MSSETLLQERRHAGSVAHAVSSSVRSIDRDIQLPQEARDRDSFPRPGTSTEAQRNGSVDVEPMRPSYLPLKYLLDRLAGAVLLLMVSPVIFLAWLAVRLTSTGPGFYRQTRMGRFGKPYEMFKIRTMSHNCEAHTGPIWSGPNDRRVTRVGRFLRDTHLDELPQLINIVRGDMSLIGPRPERPELVARIQCRLPKYPQRMQVKPGLTGFAQIQHPADLDMDHVRRKLMYDLYYVRAIGPSLDIRIALGTVLYFAGITLKALGKLLIKSDGNAAEIEHEDMELLDEAEYPSMTAVGA